MDNLIIGITGSTGYLGSNLTKYLTMKGCTIRCLVRELPVDTDKDNIEYIPGDIEKPETLAAFLKGLNICIHLAAFVGYGTRSRYKSINETGTKNLCDVLLRTNPSCRFIYCSSIAVLKKTKFFDLAISEYARSKYRGQKYAESLRDKSGLSLTVVYSGLIYGPGDQKFLPSIIRYLAEDKLILLSGGERNSPLIFIDDLCELFYRIAIEAASANNDYIGINPEYKGIHDFFKMVAFKTGNREPVLKLPRTVLLFPAVFLEELWHLFRLKKAPPITRRIVDVLSISLSLSEDEKNNNLNWIPLTNMTAGLERALRPIKNIQE